MRVPLSASPVPTSEMQVIEIKIDEAEAAYVLSISPDGRWLSGIVLDARGAVMPGVVLHELATGHSRHLGSHMRRPVDDFIWAPMAWLPDSRRGLVRWLDEVLVVDVDTGEITPLMQDLANTRGVIRPLGAEGTFLMLDTTVEGDIWLASRP